jgi:hypothetical protein
VVGALSLADAADAFGPFRATLLREETWTAETASIAIGAMYAEILSEGDSSSPLTWRDIAALAATWRGMASISVRDYRRAETIQCFALHMEGDPRGESIGWPREEFMRAMEPAERAAYMRVFAVINPWVDPIEAREFLEELELPI